MANSNTSGAMPQDLNNKPLSARPPPNRRRDKPQLSCTLCRRRKWKCDRQQPCETCVRRGLSLSCTYVNSKTSERSTASPSAPAVSTSHNNVPDRISQLERLVVSLMGTLNATKSNGASENDIVPSTNVSETLIEQDVESNLTSLDPSQLADSFGRISLENAGTTYVEGAHWSAILDGIAELKNYFEDEQKPAAGPTEGSDYEGPELLVGRHKHAKLSDILAAIPSRSLADTLIARCFGTVHYAQVLIHTPTFLQKYDQFWERPHETPIMFIGLVYALMCMAAQDQQTIAEDSESNGSQGTDYASLAKTYREKTVQCLILGKYMRPVPYTIETLIIYLLVEYARTKDAQVENWVLLGIVVKLAVRMGYHRDGSHFPSISPFQAEMRRRAWATIVQQDVVISVQVGLPRMIGENLSDTKEPRNLENEDFDENTVELRPSRPDDYPTHAQFLIGKNRLVEIFGMISDLDTSPQRVPYTKVLKFDKMLTDAYKSIPETLHVQSMSKSILEDPNLVLGRVFIALLFYKAQCVLHRKYVLPAKTDPCYTYSRTTCISAALQILEYQNTLYQETEPGGRFHQNGGKIKSNSSVIRQEYLFATTILCLDLNHDVNMAPSEGSQKDKSDDLMREEIIRALKGSYMIWLQTIDSSREARKAAAVLKIVLGNAEKMKSRKSISLENVQISPAVEDTAMYTLPSDPWCFATHISTPQGSNGNSSTGASPQAINLSYVDPNDMNAFYGWPELATVPFEMDTWDTGFRTQSFDDMLTTYDIFDGNGTNLQ